MATATTVIVTRPGAVGQTLAEALRDCGQPALWLPAFEFGPAPEEAAARTTLATLADFDLAVVVSPQAARATAALLDRSWPPATAIAAVGAGTRAAILAIDGAAAATLLSPPEERLGGGSESLWPVLQQLPRPRRVLLLRAQSGRDWLTDRLQEAGADVVPLAVYSRTAFEPSSALRAQLAAAARSGLASVVSSSDAVAALQSTLAVQPDVLQALRSGPALAAHPRIAAALRAAGFASVVLCSPACADVIAALRESQPLESPAPAAGKRRGRDEH